MISILMAIFISGSAFAQSKALEPMNRVHLGAGLTSNSLSLNLGFDSRLTRLLLIDGGGFISPLPFEKDTDDSGFIIKNGIYITPGIRIPHEQAETFTWDIIARAGGSVIWIADLEDSNRITPEISGIIGGDLGLYKSRFGLKLGYKYFIAQHLDLKYAENTKIRESQFLLEGVVQFGSVK